MHNPLSKTRAIDTVGSYASMLAADAREIVDRAANVLVLLAAIGVAALCMLAVAAFK